MERQNTIGFTITTLSNLLRRKMFQLAPPPPEREGITAMSGQIMGYLCEHAGTDIYQKDVEEVFCIRRSTASQFLKGLERSGLLLRQPVLRDARLKLLVPTPKALALHQQFNQAAQQMEALLTQGISQEELDTFLAVAHKIQRNLGL